MDKNQAPPKKFFCSRSRFYSDTSQYGK